MPRRPQRGSNISKFDSAGVVKARLFGCYRCINPRGIYTSIAVYKPYGLKTLFALPNIAFEIQNKLRGKNLSLSIQFYLQNFLSIDGRSIFHDTFKLDQICTWLISSWERNRPIIFITKRYLRIPIKNRP